MEAAANALIMTGLLTFLIGYLVGVVIVFWHGLARGAACLFIPAALFDYLSVRLNRGRVPLLLMHTGMTLGVLGLALAAEVNRQMNE